MNYVAGKNDLQEIILGPCSFQILMGWKLHQLPEKNHWATFRCGANQHEAQKLSLGITFPKTNSQSHWKLMVGRWNVVLGRPVFKSKLLVSGRVGTFWFSWKGGDFSGLIEVSPPDPEQKDWKFSQLVGTGTHFVCLILICMCIYTKLHTYNKNISS